MDQYIRAARTPQAPAIDGRLDDEVWKEAPAFGAFVQSFPREGEPPTEDTELRVLHDDDHVYIGIQCHDRAPGEVVTRLGRRDSPPYSDSVAVVLDTTHGHRSAYLFGINAGGVLSDGLFFDDSSFTPEWDGVWDGAAAQNPTGWSVEIAIPLRLLRFPAAPVQTWGFGVRREIARKHEVIDSVLIPRKVNAGVSRLGHLTGLEDLRPARDIEMTPYLAVRSGFRPQYASDAARPEPRLLDPSADVGLDARMSLGSNLALNATLNPDFGQVEADRIILNLTSFEQFFPEKRPFFTQGMDIFQPVGARDGTSPHMLFYSRRIGLETPILGAAKLTGTALPGVQVGFLDAFVTGPWAPPDEGNPDRRVQLHWTRPLHLGMNFSLPDDEPTPTNFLVGVARAELGPGATAGATVTSAIPFGRSCAGPCDVRGGNAAALDFTLRTADSDWQALGQVAASQVVGGPPVRVRRDGVTLREGDAGLGAFVRAGKLGGEPFRFELQYVYGSPRFDLNAGGFNADWNEHALEARVSFVRPNGLGPFHNFEAKLLGAHQWSADGRATPRGRRLHLNVFAVLPGFHFAGLEAGYEPGAFDTRDISYEDAPGTYWSPRIPFERPGGAFVAFFGGTDANQPLSFQAAFGVGYRDAAGPSPLAGGFGANASVVFRPHDRLETSLEMATENLDMGPHWVDVDPTETTYYFGDLASHFLSLTLRQQVVLSPRLTVQAYAQLFTAHGDYFPYYQATSEPGGIIRMADLLPSTYAADSSFYEAALNLSVVARWEYRLGSTLYLVYTHGQTALPATGPAPRTLLPRRLLSGPAVDGLMVKWAYAWNL